MTTYITALDLPALHRRFIGFDEIFNELNRTINATQKQDNYPPHNIIRKGENLFQIELAVAGFSEDELDVQLSGHLLKITGKRLRDPNVEVEYLHRGIASRDFERSFPLAENVEVRGATVQNGIMIVNLELVVPEEHKPKKIAITFAK